MADVLNIATSGLWPFIGSLILITSVGRLIVMLAIGVVASLRGSPVNYSAVSTTQSVTSETRPEDIVRIVRNAMDAGQLDAPVSRIITRNEKRRG